MAHPKRKISKQRRNKRRTHINAETPNVAICSNTGAPHLWHRAYMVDGTLYYRGKVLVEAKAV